MAHNEQTSPRVASIAGRVLFSIFSVTHDEARTLLASALTQARDRKLPGLKHLNAMSSNVEYTSERIAEIAGRGLKALTSITLLELHAVAGSVLTQAPDRDDLNARIIHAVIGRHEEARRGSGAHNALARPRPADIFYGAPRAETAQEILDRYSPWSPLADYLRRGGV